MHWSLILDIILVLLLAATIGFSFALNRRLRTLRDSRSELGQMIASFNESTQRAQGSIQELRRAADRTAQELDARIKRAQVLRDELEFFMERGDRLANELESGISEGRKVASGMPRQPAGEKEKEAPARKGPSEELLNALKSAR